MVWGMGLGLCALLGPACLAGGSDESISTESEELKDKESCGGSTAQPCPTGQKCVITDDSPYAVGFCVGTDAPHCKGVICPDPDACPPGSHWAKSPRECCGTCVMKADLQPPICKTAVDCEGLASMTCRGTWACEAGACVFTCAVPAP